MTRTIALLTDFGTTDPYVGVMKGVMLGICPNLQFLDLTHAIQPQNVKQAAFLLLNSYRYFPPDTIFLVVVDPGVGSIRKPLAVRAGKYGFVAPDNGVLSYVLRENDDKQITELNTQGSILGSRKQSNTFHGRDIFAPAAAYLAQGVILERFSRPLSGYTILPEPSFVATDKRITGEILHIDHFGSAVTSIGLLTWSASGQLTLKPYFGGGEPLAIEAQSAEIRIGDTSVSEIRRTYADVSSGKPLALVGSSGYLELAVNSGSFRSLTDVQIGDPVVLQIE